ncbi:uncharacterized protein LOC144652167 [Oculina patagonica]
MVSYDVTALFTNVPLEKTIKILAKKAFNGNWFNNTHNLNISEGDLIELLTIATKDQLFQFNGDLYEQIDGVAMGSPLGPLMANTFMCSIEEKLARENKLPKFYKRYVDDTFALVPDLPAATDLLTILNDAHPAIQFTMETAVNNMLPFVGMAIIKTDNRLNTSVYRKKTNKGLLLHYQSHVDNRYKRSLLRTMFDRAKRLSSTPDLFAQECRELKTTFLKLKYPGKLIDTVLNRFHSSQDQNESCIAPADSPVRITLPFKDQKSADYVRRELCDLGKKIDREITPAFTSKKISEELKFTETKPSLVNQQSVVYEYKCNSCDANYIGYTSRHLHLRIEEHRYSVIGKHLQALKN